MESIKDIKEEQASIKRDYVSNRQFDAVVPQLQKTLDEVRQDIKKLLVIVPKDGEKKSHN